MHNPPQARLVILLTCTKCGGLGFYDDQNGDPCNCPRCEEGWEAASVPIGDLLHIYRHTSVAADCYDELAQAVRTQKPTGHSLLRHLADDLPQEAIDRLRQPPALSRNSLLRPGNVGE